MAKQYSKLELERLLERYYNAETTLEEEEWLRVYFKSQQGANETPESALFADIAAASERNSGPVKKVRSNRRINLLAALSGIAACLIAVVLWISDAGPVQSGQKRSEVVSSIVLADAEASGEIEDPELALQQARKALAYVSTQLNRGTDGISRLEKLNESIEKIKSN